MKQIVKRTLTLFVVAIVIVGAAPFNTAFAATIGGRSPVAANSVPNNDHSHFIRKDPGLGTMRLELYGYWKSSGTGGKYFYINKGAAMDCDRNGSTGSQVGHVRVDAGGVGRDYYIRGVNMCGGNSTHSNVAGANSNNQFYARYPLPGAQLASSTAVTDASGTTWYRAKIIVEWGSDAKNGTKARLYVNGNSAVIGQVGQQGLTSASARRQTRFPVIGRTNNSSNNTSFSLPFGMTCPLNSEAVQDPSIGRNKLVTLYDADNGGGFNDSTVRLRVMDSTTGNWARLSNPIGGSLDASRTVFTPGRGETQETSVEIDMVAFHLYAVNISGVDSSNVDNVLSVGLPFDSIYGYIKCPPPITAKYNINPTVALSSSSYSSYNNLSVPWSAQVTSLTEGTMADVGAHDVDLWRIVYAPGSTVASAAIQSADTVCPVPGGYQGCTRVANFSASNPTNATPPGSYRLHSSTWAESYGPDPPGTRTCYVARVANPTQTATVPPTWRPSILACAVSVKQPTVQFLGSDVKVSGKVDTSTFTTRAPDGSQKTFGSWVEYGIFSKGANIVAGSGAGLKEGNSSATKSDWSGLTFANMTEPYGGYDPLPGVSNARAYFESLAPTVTGSYDLTKSGVYKVGNITLSGAVPTPGTSVIIQSSGTVTIDNSITVNNSNLTKVRDISQVVIIANKIDIKQNVGNIDAWLITRPGGGGINTCSDQPEELTAAICNTLLTVNGAVITDKLNLRRTHGADGTDPGAPGEIVRLRPDSQLWAFNYSNKADRAQTVYMTELPPRF